MDTKERIAEILIAEKGGELCERSDASFTLREYLQFGEDCFNAARKNNSEWYFKYKSFSDFMNSRNNGK